MTSRTTLKTYFQTGDAPTESQFAELIDSLAHASEDGLATTVSIAAAFQPLDATLTALAAVVTAANKLIYATGSDAFATCDLSAFGRSLIDDADAAAARTTIGAQATLVSGGNLKTINGESLLGSTDIVISGGGGGASDWGDLGGDLEDQTDLQAALDLKANLASPAFTGTVTGKYLTFTGDDYNAHTFVKITQPSTASATVGANIVFGSLYGTTAHVGFDNGGYFRVNDVVISSALIAATQFMPAQTASGHLGIGGGILFSTTADAEQCIYSTGAHLILSSHRLNQLLVNADGVLVNVSPLNFAYSSGGNTARTRMTAAGVRVSEVGDGAGTWQVGYSEEYHAGGVKLALFGATRIARPTTSHAAATLVGNAGTALTDTDTFDGYTLKQVVKALRDLGALT